MATARTDPYGEMWKRSFAPRQWFIKGDPPHGGQGLSPTEGDDGEDVMWVYRRSYQSDRPDRWVVGYYDPRGEWHEDSQYEVREEAAARVRWLNGGT